MSGTVTQWADLRGAGYWPALLPTGGAGCFIDGDDLASRIIRSGSGHALVNSTLKTYSGPMTFFWVGVPQADAADTGDFVFPLGIVNSAEDQGMKFNMKPINVQVTQDPLHLGGIFYPPGAQSGQRRIASGKLRLQALARSADGTTTALQFSPRIPTEVPNNASPGAISATQWKIPVGVHGGSFFFVSRTRAILVLNRVATSTDIENAIQWARRRHGSVTGAPKIMVFEGDSITAGPAMADNKGVTWTKGVSEDAFFAAYDDANIATSGANIVTTLTGRLNSDLLPLLRTDQTKKIVVIWAGTNDVRVGTAVSTILAALWTEVDAIKAAHPTSQVFVMTMIPATATGFGSVIDQTTLNSRRASLNSGIIANAASHGASVIDPCTLSAFDADADFSDSTNYLDGLHPNTTGMGLITAYVKPILQAA